MRKIVTILVACAVLATLGTVPAFAQDEAVKPLEVMSLGLAWIEPRDAPGYGALIVGLKALPAQPPKAVEDLGDVVTTVMANLSLDLILTTDRVCLGASIPLTTMDAAVEVRVGVAYVPEGWAVTVRGLLPVR